MTDADVPAVAGLHSLVDMLLTAGAEADVPLHDELRGGSRWCEHEQGSRQQSQGR